MNPIDGSVTPADAAELQQLRRRAYGPDADIASDPSAFARLAELEAAFGHLPFPVAIDVEDRTASDQGEKETVAAAAATANRPWWRSGGAWVLAVGTLMVGALLFTAIPGLLPGAPDETLHVRAHFEDTTEDEMVELDRPPTVAHLGLLREEVRLFDGFRGLRVWSVPTIHGTTCLIVTSRAQGMWASGCAPEGTDPQIELNKYENDLVHRDDVDPWRGMPMGSLIRLVLRGDTVLVWDKPAPGPTPIFG